MNNNSRDDFYNDNDMNIINVDSLKFENLKINDVEMKTYAKIKTKNFHEKNINSILKIVISQNEKNDAKFSQNENDDAEIFDHENDNFFIVNILSH